jgi:hypothetical protein
MLIFFDTEFIEDGRTIELISIGMVREDGKEYYACFSDCDLSRANDWVKENVIPLLPSKTSPLWKNRDTIRHEILEFVGPNPIFYANFASYDWVALCQLYGRMIDLPKGWPMFCRDLKQLKVSMGDPKVPEQVGSKHDALEDARQNKRVYDFLMILKSLS